MPGSGTEVDGQSGRYGSTAGHLRTAWSLECMTVLCVTSPVGLPGGALRRFANSPARRGGPVELSAIPDMVRRQRQGLSTQAAVEDAPWEEEKYARRSQDHKTQPYLAAFRACQAIVSSNGIAAVQTAALAQEFAGYHSSEGSAERIRALRRESAEQAVQLRDMLDHPLVRLGSSSPLIEIAAVRLLNQQC
jgi:hypothetical protein